jgi:hypothetical protein
MYTKKNEFHEEININKYKFLSPTGEEECM